MFEVSNVVNCNCISQYCYFRVVGKVYLFIQHQSIRKIEIDFMTEDNTLIEVKYNSQMSEKQKNKFKSLSAKKKILIENIVDLKKLDPKLPNSLLAGSAGAHS